MATFILTLRRTAMLKLPPNKVPLVVGREGIVCGVARMASVPSANVSRPKRKGTITSSSREAKKMAKTNLHPKVIVHNFFQLVSSHFKDKTLYPELKTEQLSGKKKNEGMGYRWKATMQIKWPHAVTSEAVANVKNEAETKAAMKIVEVLRELNVLSATNEPRISDRDEVQNFLDVQRAPQMIKLSSEMENRISHLLSKYSEFSDDFDDRLQPENIEQTKGLFDAITGRPYSALNEELMNKRNNYLFRHWKNIENTIDEKLMKIQNNQKSLPIYQFREQILKMIEENPVIVLSGETGCGKTTQVPQFIFNSFVEKLQGSQCNMIVTQPRRISAISISDRVAAERNENLGETVGFQVRLSNQVPREKGAILFCSSGILLRRLQNNPTLKGVSHVIIDEAHERDIITDFLLVLLKDIIRVHNPHLRLIVMSASMNTKKFIDFFDGCPMIEIPGRMFPVKDYYLDTVLRMTKRFGSSNRSFDKNEPLDVDLVANTIAAISSSRPEGAILCFLPGWQEIQAVQTRLLNVFPNGEKHLILPVHSRVPQKDQHLVFNKPPNGARKIVLATNIAETSITINDVVYVVDSGRVKETVFDPDWGVTSLRSRWVSKANIIQRRGRAGRVQAGECYHLYPEKIISELDEYPLPEIQRSSLEKVILDAKLYCGINDKFATSFLSRCPDPPAEENVNQAIVDLQKRKILTHDEKLTDIGRCVSQFSCHPYVAKAIVFGSWLRCVNPILTVSAFLMGAKEVFLKTPENKPRIKELKEEFSEGTWSDHVSLINLYDTWEEIGKKGGHRSQRQFCEERLILPRNMDFIQGLRGILINDVLDAGLVDDVKLVNSPDRNLNEMSHHWPTVKAALCAGFEPNYVRCTRGEVTRKRIVRDSILCREVDGNRVMVATDSVNSRKKAGKSDSFPELLTFFHKTCLAESGLTVIRDCSAAPALAVILFSGLKLRQKELNGKDTLVDDIDDPVILSIDGGKLLRFCCSRREAKILLELRKVVDDLVSVFLTKMSTLVCSDPLKFHRLETELLSVLRNLFEQ